MVIDDLDLLLLLSIVWRFVGLCRYVTFLIKDVYLVARSINEFNHGGQSPRGKILPDRENSASENDFAWTMYACSKHCSPTAVT